MQWPHKRKVVAGAAAALAVGGAGAGIAATKLTSSPSQESQAVISAAAKQLGVQPNALSSALKKALEDRIDAAVAAGRLTKAQGNELKQRIESNEFPLVAPRFGHDGFDHHGFGHHGLPGPRRRRELPRPERGRPSFATRVGQDARPGRQRPG